MKSKKNRSSHVTARWIGRIEPVRNRTNLTVMRLHHLDDGYYEFYFSTQTRRRALRFNRMIVVQHELDTLRQIQRLREEEERELRVLTLIEEALDIERNMPADPTLYYPFARREEPEMTVSEMRVEDETLARERHLQGMADSFLDLDDEDFSHSHSLERTSSEIDEGEITHREMEEEIRNSDQTLETMILDFLGGPDSDIEYGSPTSPTSSEVDEADTISQLMLTETIAIKWDKETRF